jgi:type IV pilus biogenesis protein PilP
MPSDYARRNLAALLLLSAAAGTVGAQAEPPTLADRLSTMDAQLQLLRKQFELDQALSISAVTTVGALPRVVAVYGFEPRLQARLLLAGGMTATFQEGDAIRGAMKVLAISPRAVLVSVKNGRRTAAIPLEFVAPAVPASAGMPLPPGQPGAPQPAPVPPELLPPPPALGMPALPTVAGGRPGAARKAAPARGMGVRLRKAEKKYDGYDTAMKNDDR